MTPKHLWQITEGGVLSALCSTAIGWVFYRWWVFAPTESPFIFPALGLCAGLFYFTLGKGNRESFALLLLLFVLYTAVTRSPDRSAHFVRNVLSFVSVGLAIWSYRRWFRRQMFRGFRLDVFVLAGLLSCIAVLISAPWNILITLLGYGSTMSNITGIELFILREFLLLGLGIGTGIMLAEDRVLHRLATGIRRFFHFEPKHF